ncbi:MAG: PadR family transcriptional regulator [Marmoricola sp.]
MRTMDDEIRPHRRHHHPGGPGGPDEGPHHGGRPGEHPADRTPPHRRGGPRRGPGRGRAARGDVRTAVLLLLTEQPMHGYQLMHAIAERTGGAWRPSPGAVYPTISQLEDEGLVSITADSGRKLVTLTEDGRAQLEEHGEAWGDPFAGHEDARRGPDLRRLVHDLHEATRLVGRTGTDAQRAAAATILADARRALFLLLADGPGEEGDA